MARKRTLSTLDTSIAYEAVGLDLAKEDVALPHSILNTRNLISLTEIPDDRPAPRFWPYMAPTLVAMEPCSGAHRILFPVMD